MQSKSYQRIDILMGRLFLFLIVCLAMLAIIEWASRILISPRPPIERRFPVEKVRHPRPYSMFSGKPNASDLNRLGYRGDAPQMSKPPGEFRIFFLGGSTVYLGDPPVAGLVQELFKENEQPHVRVYNFGVISSVSGMELARIVFEIADYSPDVIVMYNGGNDILLPWDWDPRPGYPFNFIAYENHPLLNNELDTYPTFALLMYGSNLMRWLFPDYFVEKFIPLDQARTENGYRSLEWKDEIATIYVNNLLKADKVSSAFGAEFVAFYQPLLYFKTTIAEKEERHYNHEQGIDAKQIRAKVLAAIDQTAGEASLNFIDLSDAYKEDPSYVFTDSIHTRQEVKPVVARKIYTTLSGIYRQHSAN